MMTMETKIYSLTEQILQQQPKMAAYFEYNREMIRSFIQDMESMNDAEEESN